MSSDHARAFVPPSQWAQGEIQLGPEESHHLLHVLRVKPGQRVEAFNGEGEVGVAEVVAAKKGLATLRMLSRTRCTPPAYSATLILAVTREPKMDLVVQKATELGVSAVVPVLTEHGVVRVAAGAEARKKAERWAKIALGAAKQCGTAWLPRVEPVRPLADALAARPSFDLLLACLLIPEARPIREVLAEAKGHGARRIGVLVGPEGDFSQPEVRAILAAGAVPVNLGGTTLRSETAALYVLSVLRYELV